MSPPGAAFSLRYQKGQQIMRIIETIIFTIAATLFVPVMAFASLCLFFKAF